ncbi:MAG: hypothetical protein FJW36_11475 [Acidobacteria bacterium]|nr:hypothetical protein [Acidobacteriota bacterium]
MWTQSDPSASGISTGLEFCRSELKLQRELRWRLLLWLESPVLLLLGIFLFALITLTEGVLPKGLPFLGMLFVWVISVGIFKCKEQRADRRELDELDRIERQLD